MNDEQLETLITSRVQRRPRRADGNLKRWIHTLLWLNLNVSALLLLAVLARWYYDALKTLRHSVWRAPSRTLLAVPALGVPEAVAWIIWYLPRRPGARLWAGVIGVFVFWFLGCVMLFAALAWGLKVPTIVYGLLYIGLSHLLFAFFGDDGATYQFGGRGDGAKPRW